MKKTREKRSFARENPWFRQMGLRWLFAMLLPLSILLLPRQAEGAETPVFRVKKGYNGESMSEYKTFREFTADDFTSGKVYSTSQRLIIFTGNRFQLVYAHGITIQDLLQACGMDASDVEAVYLGGSTYLSGDEIFNGSDRYYYPDGSLYVSYGADGSLVAEEPLASICQPELLAFFYDSQDYMFGEAMDDYWDSAMIGRKWAEFYYKSQDQAVVEASLRKGLTLFYGQRDQLDVNEPLENIHTISIILKEKGSGGSGDGSGGSGDGSGGSGDGSGNSGGSSGGSGNGNNDGRGKGKGSSSGSSGGVIVKSDSGGGKKTGKSSGTTKNNSSKSGNGSGKSSTKSGNGSGKSSTKSGNGSEQSSTKSGNGSEQSGTKSGNSSGQSSTKSDNGSGQSSKNTTQNQETASAADASKNDNDQTAAPSEGIPVEEAGQPSAKNLEQADSDTDPSVLKSDQSKKNRKESKKEPSGKNASSAKKLKIKDGGEDPATEMKPNLAVIFVLAGIILCGGLSGLVRFRMQMREVYMI